MEIARALASDPSLLLLDEPTAGMNPNESARLTEFMNTLRDDRGLTILLIEHDMKVVMGVSEHITVLDHGEKIAEGLPAGDPRQRARGRGLPRHEGGHRLMALLEVKDIHTYYGNIQALKGVSLTVEEGEIVTHDRLQRRRQVHHAALDLGPHAAARGLDLASRATRSARPRRRTSSAWASPSRPRAASASRA